MFGSQLKAGLIARRLTALVLVSWLAGVGCLLGCELRASAAAEGHTDERQTSAQEDSCPAFSPGRDCCHKGGSNNKTASDDKTESDEDGAATLALRTPRERTHTVPGCCPMAAGVSADPARKVKVADAPLAAASERPSINYDERTHSQPPSRRPRIPDRGGTHLRCCVFLI